jgi:hypothetical protein
VIFCEGTATDVDGRRTAAATAGKGAARQNRKAKKR